MRIFNLGACVFVLILGTGTGLHAMSITYDVDRIVDNATVQGAITTNGTLGAIQEVDIVSWDIELSLELQTVNLTPANSTFAFDPGALVATVDSLDFNLISGERFSIVSSNPFHQWTFVNDPPVRRDEFIQLQQADGSARFAITPLTDLTIGPAADTSPVPEPGTILLWGTGIAGLAAWRMRKQQVR